MRVASRYIVAGRAEQRARVSSLTACCGARQLFSVQTMLSELWSVLLTAVTQRDRPSALLIRPGVLHTPWHSGFAPSASSSQQSSLQLKRLTSTTPRVEVPLHFLLHWKSPAELAKTQEKGDC